MLLYSLLHLTGYDLSLDDLKAFRQWGSRTPGHPERGHTPGVETTTGPLGQGVGNAVGMAIAERFLAEQFNRPGHRIVDHRTWAFVSDGDLMEGVASEAASLAGHLRLGKLTLIYDDNHITIDGDTALSFSEDVPAPLRGLRLARASGSATATTSPPSRRRCEAARAETARPTLVVLRTVIADPAPTKRNTAKAHGEPLGAEEVRRTKEIMGWPDGARFYVPEDALDALARGAWRGARRSRPTGARVWPPTRPTTPRPRASCEQWLAGALPEGWDEALPGDHARRAGRSPPGRPRASRCRRSPPRCPTWSAARPISAAAPAPRSSRAATFGPATHRPDLPLGRAGARHGGLPQRHRGPRRARGRSAAPSWSSPTT